MFKQETSSPIFIGGLIKSGTSLLRSMIGQHSRIASGLETYWFDMNWPTEGQPVHNTPALPERYESDLNLQIERLGAFFKISEKILKDIFSSSSNPEQFLEGLMSYYAFSLGKKRWLEKTPGNILHIPRILKEWPDAKILICSRNPLDVFASLKESGLRDNPIEFAKLWIYYYEAFTQAIQSDLLASYQYRIVPYESLIIYTEELMKNVMDFIGEPFEKAVAKYQGQSREFKLVKKITGKKSTTLERMKNPMSDSRIDIFKNSVTQDEINIIEKIVFDAGYFDLWNLFKNSLINEKGKILCHPIDQ